MLNNNTTHTVFNNQAADKTTLIRQKLQKNISFRMATEPGLPGSHKQKRPDHQPLKKQY